MTDRGKLLVLGLQLGDGALIRRWAAAGRLPTFARLIAEGSSGELVTTADDLHVSPLPSIYTGATPGDHGVYFTFQPAPSVQGWQRFAPGLYGRPTFWKLLSEAGIRCSVLDTPYAHPESGFDGALVLDWGTWAQYLGPTGNMVEELTRAVGRYPLGLEAHDIGFMALDGQEMSRRLVQALEARVKATRWLMQARPWDALVTVLDETHAAAHYCWRPPAAGTQQAPDEQPELLAVYEALDRSIGQIIEAAGPGATVLVVSGDAIGPNRAGWHLLPQLLAKLGLLVSSDIPAGPARDAPKPAPKGFDPVKLLRDLLPKDFRKSLARMLPTALRDRLAKRVDSAAMDWSRTRAYCLLTDLEGCIRINLKGREPEGIVEPGAEYEGVLAAIEAALAELVDPATGRPAVDRILRSDSAFPGLRRDRLPDLVVHWSREAPITALSSPRIGLVEGASPDPRPGTHAGPGFAILAGPGMVRGSLPEGAGILDVAPTVLRHFAIRPPSHMSGAPWSDTTAV